MQLRNSDSEQNKPINRQNKVIVPWLWLRHPRLLACSVGHSQDSASQPNDTHSSTIDLFVCEFQNYELLPNIL